MVEKSLIGFLERSNDVVIYHVRLESFDKKQAQQRYPIMHLKANNQMK